MAEEKSSDENHPLAKDILSISRTLPEVNPPSPNKDVVRMAFVAVRYPHHPSVERWLRKDVQWARRPSGDEEDEDEASDYIRYSMQ